MFQKVITGLSLVALLVAGAVLVNESFHTAEFIREAHAALARRTVEANQRKPRIVGFQLLDDDGTNNASVAIGDTELNITDAATGQYTLTFANPFYREMLIQCQDASTDATRALCETGTKTTSTAKLYCFSGAAVTTATNFDKLDCLATGWDAAEW